MVRFRCVRSYSALLGTMLPMVGARWALFRTPPPREAPVDGATGTAVPRATTRIALETPRRTAPTAECHVSRTVVKAHIIPTFSERLRLLPRRGRCRQPSRERLDTSEPALPISVLSSLLLAVHDVVAANSCPFSCFSVRYLKKVPSTTSISFATI